MCFEIWAGIKTDLSYANVFGYLTFLSYEMMTVKLGIEMKFYIMSICSGEGFVHRTYA